MIGNRVRARIVKNKVAAPFRMAEFDIMFSQGISKMGDLLELGVDQQIVKKSGAFYSYGGYPAGSRPGEFQRLPDQSPRNRRFH